MRVVKNGFCKKPRQNVNFGARLGINNSLRRGVWSKQSVVRFGLLILSVTVGLMRFGNLLTEKLISKKKTKQKTQKNQVILIFSKFGTVLIVRRLDRLCRGVRMACVGEIMI
jgi:hypothetical protein